jgi:hypothetical protein
MVAYADRVPARARRHAAIGESHLVQRAQSVAEQGNTGSLLIHSMAALHDPRVHAGARKSVGERHPADPSSDDKHLVLRSHDLSP